MIGIYLKMSGFSLKYVRYPKYQDTAYLQLWFYVTAPKPYVNIELVKYDLLKQIGDIRARNKQFMTFYCQELLVQTQ